MSTSSVGLTTAQVQQIWKQACAELQLQLSPAVYSTWIVSNPLTHMMFLDETQALATITSPTAFHSTNLKKNLHLQIKNALDKHTGRNCNIEYKIGDPSIAFAHNAQSEQNSQHGFESIKTDITPPPIEFSQRNDASAFPEMQSFGQVLPQAQQSYSASNTSVSPRVGDLFSEQTLSSAQTDRISAISRKVGLRSDYVFETFAVSTTNEMAHAAATAVSNRPGSAYNPLFLYGGVGVGKTHLMHAIGNNIIKNDPNKKIIYSTGEEFTNEIVHAIRNKKANEFKAKYRSADVLLIDDIQFIAGKNAVQEEFFHTFNALTKQLSQIVLTSDRPPHEMNLLEDRLRSRFEAGLMIDIGQPSFELRTAILLVKAKAARVDIPIELAKTIASQVESARKIEGIITSIRSEVELKRRSITPELIEEILRVEITEKRPVIKVTPAEIIRTVANHYKLKQSAIKGTRRSKPLVTARHIAMYLLKEDLSLPLTEIGKWFSGRDHTTVLHAVRKIEKEMILDEQFHQDVSALRMTLAAISR
ncbi:MAG: chromosomal replication initiator protein DnaA [Pseudomonadales bacterium]|nr:chromosomal replication initiator protein DnaA [Candidatus Woesebacteria bacterium]MCB9801405.1 chromosomal replication initiator protein DnaA [Pseudomonadales bacterium]